jgi:hypothetical protein
MEGNHAICEQFLSQQFGSCTHSFTKATVLLNANVAFLAIQSVDSSAPLGGRSGQQRASYFSIMTSIGAIVLGLLLVRQHTTILNVREILSTSPM